VTVVTPTRRWAPWAAGVLFIGAVASWFLSIPFRSGAYVSVDDVIWASAFIAFPIVGLLLAARRPEHPLGWCWLTGVTALGLGVNLQSIAETVWFPVQTASWAGWVALAGAILVPPAMGLIAFPATFYFPDGHLPGPRWRPVVLVGYAALAVFAVASLFKPTIATASGVGDNPMGIDQAPWLESVVPVAGAILVLVIVLGALSLIGRYRKASGVERSQLKWVALALVAALLGLVFMLVSEVLGFEGDLVGLVPWLVAGLGFPTAVAIAILRYRLYDIDRLISRTVSYAIVAAVLVAVYAGFALVLGAVVGRSNALAVAGATLTAAALFSPVRRKVQRVVDRRFDRSRYDAGLVVDEFASRLRSEVDLDGLTRNLSNVVGQTLRPATVRLWLRGDPRTVQTTVRFADR
jgi:hypothetical protein